MESLAATPLTVSASWLAGEWWLRQSVVVWCSCEPFYELMVCAASVGLKHWTAGVFKVLTLWAFVLYVNNMWCHWALICHSWWLLLLLCYTLSVFLKHMDRSTWTPVFLFLPPHLKKNLIKHFENPSAKTCFFYLETQRAARNKASLFLPVSHVSLWLSRSSFLITVWLSFFVLSECVCVLCTNLLCRCVYALFY